MMIFKLIKYFLSLIYWNHQPVEKVRKMQLRKFKGIFEYAREHSEFYRDIYTKAGVMDLDIQTWEDVEKVPVIDKDLMKLYSFNQQICIDTRSNNAVVGSTSGSSGEPFKLLYTKYSDLTAYIRCYYIMWRALGYNPFRKMAIISRYNEGTEFVVEKNLSLLKQVQKTIGLFRREIIPVFDNDEQKIAKLRKFKPYILYTSISAAETIANSLIKTNQTMHIPTILLLAEQVSKEQTDKLKTVFGSKIVDLYGCQESPSIGYDTDKKVLYKLFPNSNLVEFIDIHSTEQGRQGSIVITNLINTAQPFIRYNLKDCASILRIDDFGTKVIGPIIGRISDILSFPDGTKLYHYHISQMFKGFYQVEKYKVVQINDNPIVVYLVPSDAKKTSDILEEAQTRWNGIFPNQKVSFVFIDKLEANARSGKYKVIEHLNQ